MPAINAGELLLFYQRWQFVYKIIVRIIRVVRISEGQIICRISEVKPVLTWKQLWAGTNLDHCLWFQMPHHCRVSWAFICNPSLNFSVHK